MIIWGTLLYHFETYMGIKYAARSRLREKGSKRTNRIVRLPSDRVLLEPGGPALFGCS